MKPKAILAATLLGGTLAGMGLGLTGVHMTPSALAAPAPAATPAAPLSEMLTGKTYPLTLKAEQLDSSYHLVGLVDTQGKASLYATRGETTSVSGETFWVCYNVEMTNSPVNPPQPKAGATASLIYVNLRAIQAIGIIIPIAPPAATPTAALP